MPSNTPVPMAFWLPEPTPLLMASGSTPKPKVKAKQILANLELSRARELVKKRHTSKGTCDTCVNEVVVAKANFEATEAALVSRQRNVDAARASQSLPMSAVCTLQPVVASPPE